MRLQYSEEISIYDKYIDQYEALRQKSGEGLKNQYLVNR